MRLEWIWFIALVLAAVATSIESARQIDRGGESRVGLFVGLIGVAFSATLGSLLITWQMLGGPIWDALFAWLPQRGSEIHYVSTLALFVVFCAAYFAAVMVVPVALHQQWQKRLRTATARSH